MGIKQKFVKMIETFLITSWQKWPFDFAWQNINLPAKKVRTYVY